MKFPVILCDDPGANDVFDLRRALGSAGRCELAAVVEPVQETEPAANPAGERRYRVTGTANGTLPRTFRSGEAPAAFLEFGGAPTVLVVFVSRATVPLVEALAADSRTSGWLRVGITGVRLDDSYNLAQKLLAERKLHYHEHSRTLERLLQLRLDAMLRARTTVQSGGSVQA